MAVEVPLSQGMVALIDGEEAHRVVPYKWSAVRPDGKHWYAKRVVRVEDRTFNLYLHRYLMGVPDAIRIDHINGDGLDCQRANMRIASARQNVINSKPYGGSGFKYVTPTKGGGFRVGIGANGRFQSFGSYATAEGAARVADAAAREFFGEFAWTNFEEIDPGATAIVRDVLAGMRKPRFIAPSHNTVLDDDAAKRIRELYSDGCGAKELSARFGINLSSVYHVLNGRTHRKAGGPMFRRGELIAPAHGEA